MFQEFFFLEELKKNNTYIINILKKKLTFRIETADLVTRNGGGSGALDKNCAIVSFKGDNNLVCKHNS